MAVDETVLALWQALSGRDWEAVKTFLSADCVYVDMPLGPTLAARGPDDIVKRLKVALEPLAEYENHDGLLVSNGSDVMYEHSETWRWKRGNGCAAVRYGAPCRRRQGVAVEGLLGHGQHDRAGAADLVRGLGKSGCELGI
jgi:hypothetical protein